MGETWNGVLAVFAPLLLAAAVLGGGCAVVALLARSVLRRAAAFNADPASEPVVRARRTFAVATTLASTLGVMAVALPLAAVVPGLWLGGLVLVVGLVVVLWVVRRMWPMFGERFVPAAPKPAPPRRSRADRMRPSDAETGTERTARKRTGKERAGSGATGVGRAPGAPPARRGKRSKRR